MTAIDSLDDKRCSANRVASGKDTGPIGRVSIAINSNGSTGSDTHAGILGDKSQTSFLADRKYGHFGGDGKSRIGYDVSDGAAIFVNLEAFDPFAFKASHIAGTIVD